MHIHLTIINNRRIQTLILLHNYNFQYGNHQLSHKEHMSMIDCIDTLTLKLLQLDLKAWNGCAWTPANRLTDGYTDRENQITGSISAK